MQSYPGGIESGTDWYQNDAGVVLTETTIRQTPFNAQGTPVAFRARRRSNTAATSTRWSSSSARATTASTPTSG